ncbi:hypothetical protein NDU88_003858 [Pleurodeles waltl]|uniref:Uncharacterized protein n=1 Tax=Pleurodeles waltl TaxID=8319 RepID=A0AAV7LI90_PLEWA|nr:hypothetical protein NDU88_003858 [Pleurodeles waltl]
MRHISGSCVIHLTKVFVVPVTPQFTFVVPTTQGHTTLATRINGPWLSSGSRRAMCVPRCVSPGEPVTSDDGATWQVGPLSDWGTGRAARRDSEWLRSYLRAVISSRVEAQSSVQLFGGHRPLSTRPCRGAPSELQAAAGG